MYRTEFGDLVPTFDPAGRVYDFERAVARQAERHRQVDGWSYARAQAYRDGAAENVKIAIALPDDLPFQGFKSEYLNALLTDDWTRCDRFEMGVCV